MTIFFYQSSKIKLSETLVSAEDKIETPKKTSITETSKQSEPKSLSPYDIEKFINENPQIVIENIWQELNISSKFNGLPNRKINESFFGACRNCEAETFQDNFDGRPGNVVLLRIADNSQESCRYLLFKRSNSKTNLWKLLGFIDHDFGRYQMPQHSFLVSGGKALLVIQVQTASGSGISHYVNRLFSLQKDKLIELLNFPAQGRLSIDALNNHNVTGRFRNYRIKNSKAEIEIELKVNFTAWSNKRDSEVSLWSKKQRAVYDVDLKATKVTLNLLKSNTTQDEIDSVYNFDISPFSDEDIVKYYLPELKKIANKKNEKSEWLRDFLYRFDHSPEKTILEKLFRN